MLRQLKAMLPSPLKSGLRQVAYASFAADPKSYWDYLRLTRAPRGHGAGSAVAQIRVRQLGSRQVSLRPGTTDATTVFTTFVHRYHRPPQDAVMRPAPVILDLGANIGLTMADFATAYPESRVIGVELDHQNAEICRRNISPWRHRLQLVEGAVWFEDGQLTYEVSFGSEDAFTVSPSEKSTRGRSVTARALSIASILREVGDPPVIDFMKMDIEGAESSVLEKNTEWAARVNAIKVELHHGYTHDAAIAALERMGFSARRASDHVDSVEGVRR